MEATELSETAQEPENQEGRPDRRRSRNSRSRGPRDEAAQPPAEFKTRFPVVCEGMCKSCTYRDIARAFAHLGVKENQIG